MSAIESTLASRRTIDSSSIEPAKEAAINNDSGSTINFKRAFGDYRVVETRYLNGELSLMYFCTNYSASLKADEKGGLLLEK